MTERINRLKEQCWESRQYGPAWFNADKFAELIVKECADAADMAYDARCEYPGDYVGEQMGYSTEGGVTAWRTAK